MSRMCHVYLESRIFMSYFVFSLALCVVFILSLYVCYCYQIVLFQSLQQATSSTSTSFTGCLSFCVRLVLSLHSLRQNKYDDDDDNDNVSMSVGHLTS